MDGGQAARGRAPAGREELEGVGHLVQCLHSEHAVRVEQRLVRPVLPGQGARVSRYEVLGRLGSPHLERHHGNVLRRGPRQGRAESPRIPGRLDEQRDELRARLVQRVVDVLGRRGEQLQAR